MTEKRQYVKTGIWKGASRVRTETHTHLANGRYFPTAEQAERAREAKNLSQRLSYSAPDPESRAILLEAMGDESGLSLKRLISDSRKLRRITRLIEDGTSTSDFIIKVIDIIEEDES